MGFLDKIIGSVQNWFNEKTDEEKRRLILICTAVFVVILTISVIISMGGSSRERRIAENERTRIILPIPAEELFIPDEPDFLPGVLLERERRTHWTEQDAEVFWQDPLRSGEEQWRNKIETAVDELLERVP
jgi:hypothetical protein